MQSLRLDKFLSEAAAIGRSEARKAILKGLVCVQGTVCKKIDQKILESTTVVYNGKPVIYEKFVYIMLNKPKGVVSASVDKNDVTVVDLVKNDYPKRQLFPAGRLDKDSEGFVLLTDDGSFAHDILSPKKHVSKTYIVEVDKDLTKDLAADFENGVTLADGEVMNPARLEIVDTRVAKIVLSQGVYHQIKRMLGVYGYGVNALKRIAIGRLFLDENLPEGQAKQLSDDEVALICEK